MHRHGDPFSRGKVRIAQCEAKLHLSVQCEFDLTFDDRPVSDAAYGRNAARNLCGITLCLKAADGDRTLADRLDVAVRAKERGDE